MTVSLPTSYTDTALAEVMHAWLGEVAGSLGWSVAGGSYADAITETLFMYGGVTDLSGATDIGKVRALARVAVWEAAAATAASRVDWSRGAERVSGSQEATALAKQAALARQQAAQKGYITTTQASFTVTNLSEAPNSYNRWRVR